MRAAGRTNKIAPNLTPGMWAYLVPRRALQKRLSIRAKRPEGASKQVKE